ncbi:MAG: hypothetical protein AB9835_10880 [Eubacteriales bacterium]
MTDGHKPEHISAGCIVKSLAGRDGGRLFVVSALRRRRICLYNRRQNAQG